VDIWKTGAFADKLDEIEAYWEDATDPEQGDADLDATRTF
jgi:hypothetical protein